MTRSAFIRPLVVLSVALPFLVVGVRAQQAQRGGGQPAAPQGPMAPEKYKNIKVLTDVPADQLDLTMRYVSAAVGMNCTNCHVRDQATGVFSYEKDDIRTKQTAREMMKMVKGINAGNYGVTVSCATCHNGKNRPPGLTLATVASPDELAAIAARAGGPGAAQPAGQPGGARGQAPQTPAPPLDDVVGKYVTAMGGQAAIDKLQSRVMSGTMTNRTGQNIAITIEEKGNKYRETQQFQPTPVTRGYDGSVGWLQSGTILMDVNGFLLQQTLRTADLKLPVDLKTRYSNLTAGRPTRLDGKTDVNLLTGSPAPGVTERLYFDAASGLLIRRTISTRTPLGSLNEQVDYADYRDVAGVKMPFEIKRTNWNALDTLKIVDVKPNAQIDDSRFTKPG